MLTNLLFYGIAGLTLLLVGLYGLRRVGQLGAVDGWDDEAQDRRRNVLRRGCFTCMAIGGLFLALGMASPFLTAPGR